MTVRLVSVRTNFIQSASRYRRIGVALTTEAGDQKESVTLFNERVSPLVPSCSRPGMLSVEIETCASSKPDAALRIPFTLFVGGVVLFHVLPLLLARRIVAVVEVLTTFPRVKFLVCPIRREKQLLAFLILAAAYAGKQTRVPS
jgi:hypothetical protein